MIQDFGNKIGNAAKDRAHRRQAVDAATPTVATRTKKPMRFTCYGNQAGRWWIEKVGDRAHRELFTFESRQDAAAFWHADDRQARCEAAWQAARAETNVTEDKLRRKTNSPRRGVNWRHGVDSTPDDFLHLFRPFGVEFGNWQRDRAACLNQCHDALLDMASMLGWTGPEMLFGGTLSLAFGSRGHGKAAAHYEPARRVINLTKTNGAGCLAHEWFHAYDFGKAEGVSMTPYSATYPGREWLRQLPVGLVARSREADKTRTKTYYALPEEMMARAFEAWVRASVDNDYLANIVGIDAWPCGKSRYPYPLADEMPAIDKLFRSIFSL